MINIKNLSIAIVGFGIMGKRHFDSLLSLGVENIYIVSNSIDNKDIINSVKKVYNNFDELLDCKTIDAIVICSNTSKHKEQVIKAIKKDISIFVEKPIVNTKNELEELKLILEKEQYKKSFLVGYDLRYSNLFISLKEILDSNRFGKLLFCDWNAGGYLPNWRKGRDYKSFYSAHKSLGGGVSLDLSHEIDAMIWLFGKAKSIFAKEKKVSRLDIDVEDLSLMFFDYDDFCVNIKLDYIQSPFERKVKMVFETGTIYLDDVNCSMEYISNKSLEKLILFDKELQNKNPFYDEMNNFINSITNKSKIKGSSLDDSILTAKYIFLAKESSISKKEIDL